MTRAITFEDEDRIIDLIKSVAAATRDKRQLIERLQGKISVAQTMLGNLIWHIENNGAENTTVQQLSQSIRLISERLR